MAYTYKMVPAPMVLGVGKGQTNDQAIAGFAETINRECTGGWAFRSMETITTQVPQGCLGGGNMISTTYNMPVFKKEA